MRGWAMLTPPEPDDVTRVWDRHGDCWERIQTMEDDCWMSMYSGARVTWHELVGSSGPVFDVGREQNE